MNCLQCGNIILSKDGKKFCTKACAAVYNNSRFPKRKKLIRINKCNNCGSDFETTKSSNKRKFCSDECRSLHKRSNALNQSKCELFSSRSWQAARSVIQSNARNTLLSSDYKHCCHICGYDSHVEVCHIKAVSEFDNASTLREINAVENLVLLCPNHHWEFDSKLFSVINYATCVR